MKRARKLNSRTKLLSRGLDQSDVRFFSTNPGGRIDNGIARSTLVYWESLGEVGQYLAGLVAGYRPKEIKKKREWSDGQFREIIIKATTILDDKYPNESISRSRKNEKT